MNEIQRRLLAEAAKYGGRNVSEAQKMADAINEAPAMITPTPSPFGYSKPQFESRMRELIRRMGFEKGITNIRSEGSKMVVCFALAPKARDFMLTINKLLRIKSSGDVASMDTTFNPIKAPAGTKAIVTLDFSNVRQESTETAALDAADGLLIFIEAFLDEGGIASDLPDSMLGSDTPN